MAFGQLQQERVQRARCEASSPSRNASSDVPKRSDLGQFALAGGGESDGVAPAITRVALPFDQTELFELVQEPDQLPLVVTERLRDRPLGLA